MAGLAGTFEAGLAGFFAPSFILFNLSSSGFVILAS
jgi:hypothetical protein